MNVYLTLDYELYMGANSGSVQNCLVSPMNKLVERTDDLDVSFTLFVDAAYLYILNELRAKHDALQKDFEDVSSNLRQMSELGHSIQLHIHPQWYFSSYNNRKWVIDQEHYKLSDLSIDNLARQFSSSKKILEDIIGKKVTAFRAGGYSLQTLNNYANFLSDNGILQDSSAASGQEYKSRYQWYDYKNVKSGNVYRFSDNISIKDNKGKLLEYPISSIHLSTVRYLSYRVYVKYFKSIGKPFGDGIAVPASRKLGLFETRVMNYSFDYVMAPMLLSAFNILKKSGQEDVVLIGHPKNQSVESIEELRKFILGVRDKTTFKTII